MKKSHPSSKGLEELYQAILRLRSLKECKMFFRDLCTLSEMTALTERFQVVQMIEKGIPYRQISQKTGASTATITRVAHWFRNGTGGYRLVLRRLK